MNHRSMSGRTCIVTGANGGIGKVTALQLCQMGARTLLVCRRRSAGEQAAAEIRRRTGSDRVELLLADFASLSQVRDLAQAILERCDRIDALVNNASVVLTERQETEDGYERVFAVNHLAPFLLTRLLLARLEATGAARVVNVASDIHRMVRLDLGDLQTTGRRYRGMAVYARSKLANILFTRELARRLRDSRSAVTANALHPGVFRSGFGREARGALGLLMTIGRPLLPSPERAARTSVYLAAAAEAGRYSGEYFVGCRPARPSAAALDSQAARRLWDLSCELVGLPREKTRP